MNMKKVSGVYAAVLTPRKSDDSVDVEALRTLIRFLNAQGISSFAMNGATAEFCLTTPEQLRIVLSTVRAECNHAEILCGVGAAGTAGAIERAAIAQDEGVHALLLPMPYFFPYGQEDLDGFSRSVAGSTNLPVLLYNLPQFTTGLTKETVRTLITEVPNIIGIKDSSGSLEILRDLTTHGVDACRIVGNDSALGPALIESVCDGVVSGVACALPELILALYSLQHRTSSQEFKRTTTLLDQFIEQLSPFPTPWGLKWIVQARGLFQATFAQPIAQPRLAQSEAMMRWFADWYPAAMKSAAADGVLVGHQ